METKLIDVFVSYSRADSVQVESWVKRLSNGGVVVWFDEARDNGPRTRKISARAAAERCEVLVWFVSKFGSVSPEAGSIAAYASGNGKAVLIVVLDTVPVPKVFDVALPKVSVIDLLLLGREDAWEAFLKGVRNQGVPWIHPTRTRLKSALPNRRRRSFAARAGLGASVVGLMLLVLMLFLWPRLKHVNPLVEAPHPPVPAVAPPLVTVAPAAAPVPVASPAPAAVVPAAPPAPAPVVAPPLVTMATATPPAAPPAPVTPAPAASRPPQPAIPVEVPSAVEDPHSKRAMEYVTRCIAAAGREHGLTPEQIEAIAGFFADPVRVEGMGLQPASAIKASLQSRQREWPKWKETIHFIKAEETPDPACREVVVQLSYAGESSGKDTTRGVLGQHYIVDFTNEEKPRITKLWIDDPKRKP